MPCFYLLSPFSQQLSFHSSIPFTSTFGSKVAVKNNTVLLTIIIRRGVHNRKTHSLTTNIRLTNIHTTVSLTQGWCLKSIISFSNGGLRVVLNKIYGDCLLSTIKTTTTASLYHKGLKQPSILLVYTVIFVWIDWKLVVINHMAASRRIMEGN